jgi:ferredoxin
MNYDQQCKEAIVLTNERFNMANRNDKAPENVLGAYYVDATCIDCDLCRNCAPQFLTRQDEGGYTYVYKQPISAEEILQAEEARLHCPTDSIGNDG